MYIIFQLLEKVDQNFGSPLRLRPFLKEDLAVLC